MFKKSIFPEVIEAASNRRSFVKKLGIASAAVGAAGALGQNALAASGPTATDVAILNFALNLEYLESEFYTYATEGVGIESKGIGVDGSANGSNPKTGGLTTGGKMVPYSNDLVFTKEISYQIADDERAHVTLIRGALKAYGAMPIAKPNINLDALGFGFANEADYLKLARIFEDIGVTAYGGAAPLLSPLIVATAARILAAEAEHVGTIRTQIARLNVPSIKLDSVDIVPPPTGSQIQYLSLDPTTGLSAIRTPGQVLYLAFDGPSKTMGGFFPTGVNGAPGFLESSSSPA